MAGTTARIGSAPLPDGREAEEFVLDDGRGMAARVGAYGARLLSLRVPDRTGAPVEVVLGYDDLRGWAEDGGFFGATIGRCANRIAGGRFELDGQTFHVPVNNGPNALHGGPRGFDKAIWHAEPAAGDAAALTLSHTSPDGDQGFPGALRASVRYALSGDGALRLDYEAETDRPTAVNLTNHAYFNLAGGGSVLDHLLTIAADRFTPVDAALIPTGELRPVAGTPFDFREPARIGARVDESGDEQLRIAGGYDHNFVLRPAPPGGGLRFAARLQEPSRGLVMEVWTTEPGLQFYSGNFLDGSRRGRGGAALGHRGGLCLETQHFPDSPNRPDFPPVLLRPGETFRSSTLYRFAAAP
jgi:aldose 1-epimerase